MKQVRGKKIRKISGKIWVCSLIGACFILHQCQQIYFFSPRGQLPVVGRGMFEGNRLRLPLLLSSVEVRPSLLSVTSVIFC